MDFLKYDLDGSDGWLEVVIVALRVPKAAVSDLRVDDVSGRKL